MADSQLLLALNKGILQMSRIVYIIFWGSLAYGLPWVSAWSCDCEWRSHDRDPAEREKKKPSGRGSYKPHFHAILKPNTSPNRFLRDLFAFVIDMSARVTTMRETAQKLSQHEEWNCQAE